MDQQTQLALVVGGVVSLLLQIVKKLWPTLDCTDATVKQITAAAAAAVGVFALAGWQLSNEVAINMAAAALAALATHRALLQQPITQEAE